MLIRKVFPEEKDFYNRVAKHPLQSWEWGEFKESTGMKAVRLGVFEKDKMVDGLLVLFRQIPKTSFSAGQLLKGSLPIQEYINALSGLAREQKAIFIKIEPSYIVRRWKNEKGEPEKIPFEDRQVDLEKIGLTESAKPLFDPYSFILNLTKTEDELLSNMHSKTRYNIRLAEKNGVTVEEKSDDQGLEIFISLLQKTLRRQKFYMHSPDYFRKMWQILFPAKISHILLAKYKQEVLGAWMLFTWKDTLFYPYGASNSKHRELMASNLLCWKAILFGKQNGCHHFDLWGGLGPDADKNHPWYGFHRFKLGYGPDLVEYSPSWDLITNQWLYQGLQWADSLRWKLLRLRRRLPF
ncbi:MAG: peptidoglycan bridge formation glycyltransferase FemA/FemB family protein [Patescibacteria group bacterium]|nr:peptidoglycan bridge formation glycyltransferase FemA/FemB family protein [Patescibacteria group bacterium]